MIRVDSEPEARIVQGDIFREVQYIESIDEEEGILEISKIVFPLIIVLTQDCDLEQYNRIRERNANENRDKWLLSVLVAPLYNAEHVYQGTHLSDLDLEMQLINKTRTPGKHLRSNQNPRYHFLEFPTSTQLVPAAVIDFKHYFSVSVDYLYGIKKTNYVCRISELFREDISHRFAGFLSRIGLPEIE